MTENKYSKILVLGAGPVVIGSSSEYDYSAASVCRALKEEGISVVSVNSNPDTIMTDKNVADTVYIEPLNGETVKKIIEKEIPDAIIGTTGGEAGLEICLELLQNGYLDEHGTKLLGIKPETIKAIRNEQALRDTLENVGEPYVSAKVLPTDAECVTFAGEIGFPVLISPAFTPDFSEPIRCENANDILSGFGSCAERSLVNEVYVRKCVDDYKEVEFVAMRDSFGNCISVSSTENIDSVGIHSGDSIVVIPAQTLTDSETVRLRRAARKIADYLNIEGSCNVRFAINSDGSEYMVLAVEPQLNRTTALVSKATGYPIAQVSAKIALGYKLYEIKNDITGVTTAANEPAIDYCAVKVPRWSFENFDAATRKLGGTMQATGEALAIGTSFELALMKAIRSMNPRTESVSMPKMKQKTDNEIKELLLGSDDERIFAVYEAIRRGFDLAEIQSLTRIDNYYLTKLKNIADTETSLCNGFSGDLYFRAKTLGFLDSTIEKITGEEISAPIAAGYNTVDTCAAEFDVKKPYFYSSFDEDNEAAMFGKAHPTSKKKILVVGSGPTSIGLGTDRDYAVVNCINTLKDFGYSTILLNNNPAAVSTDPGVADTLYLDPITDEDVRNVVLTEKPYGAVLPFGGGNAVRKAEMLRSLGVKVFGSDDEAHRRLKNKIELFDILDDLGIRHTNNRHVMIGKGAEVDVLSDGSDILVPGICEHIEKACVNPGDTTTVFPSITLTSSDKEKIYEYTEKLCKELKIKGLINIQFVIYDNEVYVSSASVVATRNVPFMTKASGLPIVAMATRLMLGETLGDIGMGCGILPEPTRYFVRVPVFSFEKLQGTDVQIGDTEKSTGEVMGIADTFDEALLKGLIASGMRIKRTGGVLVSVADTDKRDSVMLAGEFLKQGFKIYATSNTAKLLNSNHVAANSVRKIHEGEPNTMSLIKNNKLSYVVSTAEQGPKVNEDDIRIRRTALLRRIPVLPSVDTAFAFAKCLENNNILEEIKVCKL